MDQPRQNPPVPWWKTKFAWLIFAILAAVGILVPNLHRAPPAPKQPIDPIVAEIKAESALLTPLVQLDESLDLMNEELHAQLQQIADDRLKTFTASTNAEESFVNWVEAHRPVSLDTMRLDSDGRKILDHFRNALTSTANVQLLSEALKEARQELAQLRRDVQKALVTRTPIDKDVKALQRRFEDLKASISPGNPTIESKAEKEADTELLQRFFEIVPSTP